MLWRTSLHLKREYMILWLKTMFRVVHGFLLHWSVFLSFYLHNTAVCVILLHDELSPQVGVSVYKENLNSTEIFQDIHIYLAESTNTEIRSRFAKLRETVSKIVFPVNSTWLKQTRQFGFKIWQARKGRKSESHFVRLKLSGKLTHHLRQD